MAGRAKISVIAPAVINARIQPYAEGLWRLIPGDSATSELVPDRLCRRSAIMGHIRGGKPEKGERERSRCRPAHSQADSHTGVHL